VTAPYICSRCGNEVTRLVTYTDLFYVRRRMCVACAEEVLATERRPSGSYPCCGGHGEHFDFCQVGADIAAARQAIARSTVPTIPLFEAS